MFSDMSESLSDKPDGTTPHAQVNNTCLPAGQVQKGGKFLLEMLVTTNLSWSRCGDFALEA
jgi:hypothetical protein